MSLGYENAPISFMMTVFGVIGCFRSMGAKDFQGLALTHLFKGKFSQLLTSQMFFDNTPQLFVGAMLIYTLRQFERQMGTRKFAAFLTISFGLSTLSQIAILSLFSSMGWPMTLSPGPYFYIYSLLPLFHRHIPKLYSARHSVLKMPFSEKSWTYLFALQLMFSDGLQSFLACSCGLISGYLYLNNVIGLQNVRLPAALETIFRPLGSFISLLNANTSTNQRQRDNNPNPNPIERRQNLGALAGNRPTHAQNFRQQQQVNVNPPAESDIQAIMNLGFERQQAIDALIAAGNNVEAAANNLFSGH